MTFHTKSDGDNLSDTEYMESLDEDCRIWVQKYTRAGESSGDGKQDDIGTLTVQSGSNYAIILGVVLKTDIHSGEAFVRIKGTGGSSFDVCNLVNNEGNYKTMRSVPWMPATLCETKRTGSGDIDTREDALLHYASYDIDVYHNGAGTHTQNVEVYIYHLDNGTLQ